MTKIEPKASIEKIFSDSSDLIKESTTLIPEIEKVLQIIIHCIKHGNKIVVFGNGGSAADAQHIAAELVGKFQKDRSSFPAIALTTDSSVITSIGNDFSFENIFSRQCEGLASKDDVAIGISTSGNSENVVRAINIANEAGCETLAICGYDGGKVKKIAKHSVHIKSFDMQLCEDAHFMFGHMVMKRLCGDLINT